MIEDLTYKVEVEVKITNLEAGLLYKYLKTYEKGELYLQEDRFAHKFKNFETESEFYVDLDTVAFDICIGAQEDQEFNDVAENELRQNLLIKLYDWAYKAQYEEDYIDKMKSDFYHYQFQLGIDSIPHFTFSKYLELRNLYYYNTTIKKPKKSIITSLKNRIFGNI